MLASDEASYPEPCNIFIYNEDTKYDIPKTVTHVKVDPSVKEIHDRAFKWHQSLVKVEFSEGLERIGSFAFYGCSNLTHIINKLPSTLKEIGDCAFEDCQSLDSIEFPEGLQRIGMGAFGSCRNLKRIKILSALVAIESNTFSGCHSLVFVDLPEGLQAIGNRCFFQCFGLNNIQIPSSVVTIGAEAFAGCLRLISVHLLGNLRTIEEYTFFHCRSLTHVRLPSTVTRIERAAFALCSRLISLELPEGLEAIQLNKEREYADRFIEQEYDDRFIYGCILLVNLVIPQEQYYEPHSDDQETIMDSLMLQHVASSFDDLVGKLKHRFDDLRVHRLCYYQSYYPLTVAMENLREIMDADPSAGNKLDSLGMTPFHILALSQTPKHSLFQALLTVYKVDGIHAMDKFGSTPLNYLCLNHTPDSAMVIQSLLQTIIAQRLHWLGLNRWKLVVLAAMDEALVVEWSCRRREIGRLYFTLETYERLEAISMLELALWKLNINGRKPVQNKEEQIDEEGACSLKGHGLVEPDFSQEEAADRQSCRINSGAEVVIPNVLPFLDKVCRNDYYSED
jgi:hypothetical protein